MYTRQATATRVVGLDYPLKKRAIALPKLGDWEGNLGNGEFNNLLKTSHLELGYAEEYCEASMLSKAT